MLVRKFGEHFGQGSITYQYVIEDMPHDAYVAWWAFFSRWDEVTKARKAQEEHDDLMKQAAKATGRR